MTQFTKDQVMVISEITITALVSLNTEGKWKAQELLQVSQGICLFFQCKLLKLCTLDCRLQDLHTLCLSVDYNIALFMQSRYL